LKGVVFNMVQGKKLGDQTNGTTKYKDQQQPNMSFQRKDLSASRGGSESRVDGRSQNGNAGGFRTDSAISGNRVQGERPLQKWVPDSPAAVEGSLESTASKSKGVPWDQFAENERRFGIRTDYDENIYTTTIDKTHPNYKQRVAEADRLAREIERSTTTNTHVAEERITDNLTGDGGDEEDKYSGVRRQDFPPLSSSSNKYTPPARRAPTSQSTVPGAPVDPAILSTARPEKKLTEKSKAVPSATTSPAAAAASTPKTSKPEASTPAPAAKPSNAAATPDDKDPKPSLIATPSSSSTVRKASPHTKTDGTPNATATVERDVVREFKSFATQQKKMVETVRQNRARNDKEVKLNDLKKFADSFKLNTPVPSDLVSIIAKDPAKQKEIQEKAKRNAEQAKVNPAEAAKPMAPVPESKPAPRPTPPSHGASPAANTNRQNAPRNQGFSNQGQYSSQSYRNDRSSQGQQMPQQRGQPGHLGPRLRSLEQNKQNQLPPHPMPSHENRLPPTGPSNISDSNFSRRSSGVTSIQGGRLNPNSSEFRPSPHAATFNPNGNPSSTSSPRSVLTATAPAPPSRERFMLKRKPVSASERPAVTEKFSALEHIKTILPGPEKNWKATGGLKPAYDTPPVWKTSTDADKPDSNIHLTYTKLFEMTPYPAQTMSPPHPSHVAPQVPHQHQLPFHLQQNHTMMPRQSPRQPPMNMGNQHNHGPNQGYNNADDHRMMTSHSAQSFASPRMQNNVIGYPSPMNQPAQLAYNPAMQYGGPPMAFRSLSQSQQFMPQQGHMVPPIMMQNPGPGFMAAQGMAPGPGLMYPQGGQAPFMPPVNGHPPSMPVNGYPSPGRTAPMMMSSGSSQGHPQQQQQMFSMNPGMSPGPQYPPMYPQQQPGQMPMRGYANPGQFGTSPQQMHQFGNQHRNNHQNGNYNNNNKNFHNHGQHPNGPPNNQVPTGPQVRNSEGGEESK
jgi:hypothetical protein